MEAADPFVAEVFVEVDAVGREVGVVVGLGVADAGVEVEDAHVAQEVFEGAVELAADACAAGVHAQVDGHFRRPVVGGAADEGVGVGVAEEVAAALGDEVGVARQDVFHAAQHGGGGRRLAFKGDGGLLDVGAVDGGEGARVLRAGDADGEWCFHGEPPYGDAERRNVPDACRWGLRFLSVFFC